MIERTNISPCGAYRYTLYRCLTSTRESDVRVAFIMLNPSTADAERDDPTIRRVRNFARDAFGGTQLIVVNLFALRATDPRELRRAADPVGPENDDWLVRVADWADSICVAWGNHGRFMERDRRVSSMLQSAGHALQCLAQTRVGQPGHPLYLPRDARPVAFG